MARPTKKARSPNKKEPRTKEKMKEEERIPQNKNAHSTNIYTLRFRGFLQVKGLRAE